MSEKHHSGYMHEGQKAIVPDIIQGIGNLATSAFAIVKISVQGVMLLRDPEVGLLRRHPDSDVQNGSISMPRL